MVNRIGPGTRLTCAHIRSSPAANRSVALGSRLRLGKQGHQHPDRNGGLSGAQVEIGNTINYGSFGTTAEYSIAADGKSLNVGRFQQHADRIGACREREHRWRDNKITFETGFDKDLSVVGLNNIVHYSDGDPKINDTGSATRFRRAERRPPAPCRPAPGSESCCAL